MYIKTVKAVVWLLLDWLSCVIFNNFVLTKIRKALHPSLIHILIEIWPGSVCFLKILLKYKVSLKLLAVPKILILIYEVLRMVMDRKWSSGHAGENGYNC